MTETQFIERNDNPLYQRMVETMEGREDIEALERFQAEDDGFRIPESIF